MPAQSTLFLFMLAAGILLITPGPAVLYIVARSIHQGRFAGFVSALGLASGTLFHIAAAALGVSALLLSSVFAFQTLKYAGAAYLVYLGIQKFKSQEEIKNREVEEKKTLRQVYVQGIIVNLLNPKTSLFFFSFLPQFIDPSKGTIPLQVFLFGGIFVLMGIFSDSLYVILSGTFAQWLRRSPKFIRGERYFAGSVYIALGLTTALTGSAKKS
jgi:threonine/homoserine/homoserine lactone efflux protein